MPVKFFGLVAVALATAFCASAQVSILQIHVVEGEGAVHPPGARSSRPVVISIRDDQGRPVPDALVSLHVTTDGPGGKFANGLGTDVLTTDARGLATVRAFQANRIAGPFQIRIVASKDHARAGAVSFQYVGVAASSPGWGRNWKWVVLGVLAGGGGLAAAGLAHGGSTPAVTPPVAPPAPVGTTIGPPSISVGRQ